MSVITLGLFFGVWEANECYLLQTESIRVRVHFIGTRAGRVGRDPHNYHLETRNDTPFRTRGDWGRFPQLRAINSLETVPGAVRQRDGDSAKIFTIALGPVASKSLKNGTWGEGVKGVYSSRRRASLFLFPE